MAVVENGMDTNLDMNATEGYYYIVVKHRNHLSIMSSKKIQLFSKSTILYNFSVADSQYYGIHGAKFIKSVVWGLYTGDANSDGGVYTEDYTQYRLNQGKEGYYSPDFNVDGGIYAEDYSFFRRNQGKETALP
jgi:hypothetical protein